MVSMRKDRLVTPSYCFILAANFLLFFGFYLLMPVLPFYLTETFGASGTTVGIALSCYTAAALSVRPFSGYLLDTFARKPLYLLAYFVFTAVFVGYLAAGTLTLFMIFRVVHGLSFGTVTVAGNTVVIDIMPSSRRGEGIGYYGLANNIAMAVGPMTGLFLYDHCSFDTIFACALVSCVLGFASAVLVRTPVKVSVKREPVSLDRFILLKGIPAGVDLLLLSVPYGMTTTYVAMYARQVGIESGSGHFPRDVFSVRLLFRAGVLCGGGAVESGAGQRDVLRDGAAARCRVRDDVSGLQLAVRQSGAQQQAGHGHFDLPHGLGFGHRHRAALGRIRRSGRDAGPGLSAGGLSDGRLDALFPVRRGASLRTEQAAVGFSPVFIVFYRWPGNRRLSRRFLSCCRFSKRRRPSRLPNSPFVWSHPRRRA